ncbi:hypothetical protein BDR04DRAFT_1194871 [Suillus decipiens]|nr:hypothetical protein BDR04DRAFT_1194871 [Suillus decipiens]
MSDLLCSILGGFTQYQTGNITAEQSHDEFLAYCSSHDPELRSTHRVVGRYSHDWWKDQFDTLGFPLLFLDINEVMDIIQDHFEQLVANESNAFIISQVKGDPLLNQILVVMAHMKHLGKSLTSLLEEKTMMAAEAAKTMSQLEGPMGELEEVLSKAQRQFVSQ